MVQRVGDALELIIDDVLVAHYDLYEWLVEHDMSYSDYTQDAQAVHELFADEYKYGLTL